MISENPVQGGTSVQRSDMNRTRSAVVELLLGILAWALVLGLGFSFTLLVRVTTWRVILPVEFSLLGLVVLAATVSGRRNK